MKKRCPWVASLGLFAAMLALAVTALAPAAVAASSASPSPSATAGPSAPKGTPIVVGVVPDPKTSGQNWTGDRISANLVANGATVDTAKCKVFVNGKEQALASPPSLIYLAPANPTLQFLLKNTFPNGSYDFKIVIVTNKGVTVEHAWKFTSKGAASGARSSASR